MTPKEREAIELAYYEIHKLINAGAKPSQSTVDACVALRQAMSPPTATDKLRQAWQKFIDKRMRNEKW